MSTPLVVRLALIASTLVALSCGGPAQSGVYRFSQTTDSNDCSLVAPQGVLGFVEVHQRLGGYELPWLEGSATVSTRADGGTSEVRLGTSVQALLFGTTAAVSESTQACGAAQVKVARTTELVSGSEPLRARLSTTFTVTGTCESMSLPSASCTRVQTLLYEITQACDAPCNTTAASDDIQKLNASCDCRAK